jgi:insertion element IS1 protein InsB
VAGDKLWLKLEHKAAGAVMTDHGKAYAEFIPKAQHIQSKAETLTVEGYKSLCRHFLARLRQKTKCYSKSVAMLEYSIRLLMAKWNKQLSILNWQCHFFFCMLPGSFGPIHATQR